MRMNSETRRQLFLQASRQLCDVATLLEQAAEPDSDAEQTQEPGYSIEVLDAEEELLEKPQSRSSALRILDRVFRAGREEASEEMFARGYAAGRCEMATAKTTLGGGRASVSQAAADLAGDNVRPMNPTFRYRGEFRDRAPSAEYPGD